MLNYSFQLSLCYFSEHGFQCITGHYSLLLTQGFNRNRTKKKLFFKYHGFTIYCQMSLLFCLPQCADIMHRWARKDGFFVLVLWWNTLEHIQIKRCWALIDPWFAQPPGHDMKPNVVVCLYHLVLCSESGRKQLLFIWLTLLSLLLKPHCEQINKRKKKTQKYSE